MAFVTTFSVACPSLHVARITCLGPQPISAETQFDRIFKFQWTLYEVRRVHWAVRVEQRRCGAKKRNKEETKKRMLRTQEHERAGMQRIN
ncbi:hypothetical protein LX36DRAFT_655831, partial [Colletotrichum falcatum]